MLQGIFFSPSLVVHLDTSGAEEAEDAGDGYNMSVILGLHLREEGLHRLKNKHTYTGGHYEVPKLHCTYNL